MVAAAEVARVKEAVVVDWAVVATATVEVVVTAKVASAVVKADAPATASWEAWEAKEACTGIEHWRCRRLCLCRR